MLRITIDTGRNVGWALWSSSPGPESLLRTGVLKYAQMPWESAVEEISRDLQFIIESAPEDVSEASLEYPSYFESEAGRASAAEGSLVKLAIASGMQYQVCCGLGLDCEWVPVNAWKGQLSKPNVIRRIKRILPASRWSTIKTHAWDAVGIGLWKKGLL